MQKNKQETELLKAGYIKCNNGHYVKVTNFASCTLMNFKRDVSLGARQETLHPDHLINSGGKL